MRKPVRNLLVVASAGMLTFGGLAIAGPATASDFGGNLSCPASTAVSARGTKGGTGFFTMAVPGRSYTDTSTELLVVRLRGSSSSGSWYVRGAGATAGVGYCA